MPQLCGAAGIVGAYGSGMGNDPSHLQRLRKPATGSFVAVMDGSAPPIFFFAKKKQKQGTKDEGRR